MCALLPRSLFRSKKKMFPGCWECLLKAALEPFLGVALAEENCPIKGHTSFRGQPTCNSMTDRHKGMKAKLPAPSQDNLGRPSQLQSSPLGPSGLALGLHYSYCLPLPNSVSFPSLPQVLSPGAFPVKSPAC